MTNAEIAHQIARLWGYALIYGVTIPLICKAIKNWYYEIKE